MANTNIDWKLIVQHQTYMKQPGKKRRLTLTRNKASAYFSESKRKYIKQSFISEYEAIMDKHVSIYAVIPICRSDVLPYFSQKQERRSGNYLISVSNPVPIPDRRFPNCPENLNFRWSWFPIRSSFLCQIPVTRFPDNLCLRWSPIPIPISMLIPVSLFSRQF